MGTMRDWMVSQQICCDSGVRVVSQSRVNNSFKMKNIHSQSKCITHTDGNIWKYNLIIKNLGANLITYFVLYHLNNLLYFMTIIHVFMWILNVKPSNYLLVYVLTEVLFWCLFHSFLPNAGKKHQYNLLGNALTVHHSSPCSMFYIDI